jgi:hypothetical protein
MLERKEETLFTVDLHKEYRINLDIFSRHSI